MQKVGTKRMVYNGTAEHTPGGLVKADLMKNAAGHIVSKKQHKAGLKAIKRLQKLGYKTQKGKFRLFTKKSRKSA